MRNPEIRIGRLRQESCEKFTRIHPQSGWFWTYPYKGMVCLFGHTSREYPVSDELGDLVAIQGAAFIEARTRKAQ